MHMVCSQQLTTDAPATLIDRDEFIMKVHPASPSPCARVIASHFPWLLLWHLAGVPSFSIRALFGTGSLTVQYISLYTVQSLKLKWNATTSCNVVMRNSIYGFK